MVSKTSKTRLSKTPAPALEETKPKTASPLSSGTQAKLVGILTDRAYEDPSALDAVRTLATYSRGVRTTFKEFSYPLYMKKFPFVNSLKKVSLRFYVKSKMTKTITQEKGDDPVTFFKEVRLIVRDLCDYEKKADYIVFVDMEFEDGFVEKVELWFSSMSNMRKRVEMGCPPYLVKTVDVSPPDTNTQSSMDTDDDSKASPLQNEVWDDEDSEDKDEFYEQAVPLIHCALHDKNNKSLRISGSVRHNPYSTAKLNIIQYPFTVKESTAGTGRTRRTQKYCQVVSTEKAQPYINALKVARFYFYADIEPIASPKNIAKTLEADLDVKGMTEEQRMQYNSIIIRKKDYDYVIPSPLLKGAKQEFEITKTQIVKQFQWAQMVHKIKKEVPLGMF